jgi:uncharacterized protein involved in exopolysaccharide biosynthesis
VHSSSDIDNSAAADPMIEDDRQEFTLLGLVNIVLANWKLVVLLPLAFALFVGIRSLMSPVSYYSKSEITPGAASSQGRSYTNWAAQFGISVAPPPGTENTAFYLQLLKSREILRRLAETKYQVKNGDGPPRVGNYIELSGIIEPNPSKARLQAIRNLEGSINAVPNIESNIITVTVSSWSPELAVQLNRRLLELGDEYNAQRRRSQAGQERKFVQAQLDRARNELESAERAMEAFLAENRRIDDSPSLQYEHSRLQRRIQQREQVFASLAQAFEQASVDEVRNTPVLSIISPPEIAVETYPRGTMTKVMLALLFGFVLAVAISYARVLIAQKRASGSEDYHKFVQLWHNITGPVVRRLPAGVRQARVPLIKKKS